jgi:hypothetical protein
MSLSTYAFLSVAQHPDITPLGWEHINLIGQYSFTHQSARSLDNLRPLRLPEQEEQAEDEQATRDQSPLSSSSSNREG